MLLQQNSMFRKTIPLLLLLLLPQLSSAEDLIGVKQSPGISQGSVEIEGDNLETLLDRKMKAKGNAILKKGNKTIKADVIEYDEVSEKLTTNGDTTIDLENMSFTGSKLTYKLSDETGQMDNVSFNSKSDNKKEKLYIKKGYLSAKRTYDYRGEAKTIFFEGENKKRLESSKLTTCESMSNDWFLKSSDMTINNKTGRVDATNSSIEFKGLPILYTPYINFSLNNERKSGFLSPTFGTTSKSGFDFQIPYYFNIAPNQDATLIARYLGKRGAQANGEYRYMGENYSGKNEVQFLNHDEASGQDNRYYISLQHKHDFGNGWSGAYNFQKVSDNQYFSDLASMIQITSVVNLPQRAQINYSDEIWKFNLLTEKYQTLSDPSKTALQNSSRSPYQRLPQLNLSANDILNGYEIGFKSQWTYFQRDGNFKFNNTPNASNDSSASGSRFVLVPSLAIPISESFGYIKPKFTVNFRSYNLDNPGASSNKNENIVTPIFSVDSGIYLDRSINIFNQTYTNSLEPRLFYTYIPYRNQSNLPLFDTGITDLNIQSLFLENQYNGPDRINDANQITAALTSRILDKDGKERFAGIIAQRYYFEGRKVFESLGTNPKENKSDIFVGATMRLANSLNLDGMFQYDANSNKLLRSTLNTRYNPEPGKMLNLSYRMIDNIVSGNDNLKTVNIAGQWPLGNRFYSIGRYNYDLKTSQTIEALGGIEYDGGCWTARTIFDRISLPTSPAPNYSLFMQIELNGLGSIGTDPNKLNSFLNRNVPGARTANEIPEAIRQENFN